MIFFSRSWVTSGVPWRQDTTQKSGPFSLFCTTSKSFWRIYFSMPPNDSSCKNRRLKVTTRAGCETTVGPGAPQHTITYHNIAEHLITYQNLHTLHSVILHAYNHTHILTYIHVSMDKDTSMHACIHTYMLICIHIHIHYNPPTMIGSIRRILVGHQQKHVQSN